MPGLMGHGEDFAFTLSELGATGGLLVEEGLADLGVNRILLSATQGTDSKAEIY